MKIVGQSEDESLLLENRVERERLWANKGTTTSPLQRAVFTKGGEAVYVVDSEGSPAVGAPHGKPAGYLQQQLLPVRPTESSAKGKVGGICQQKTQKLQDKVRVRVSLW